MSLHAENRARLVARLREAGADAKAVVILEGGPTPTRHETDHEPIFRQESNFHWAFGVREPDWFGAIEVGTGRTTLFAPRLDPSYAIWMGKIKGAEEWKAAYGVDAVVMVDGGAEIAAAVTALAPSSLLLLDGENTDSKRRAKPAHFEGIDAFASEKALLWPAITECRVFKSDKELALLRFINTVSSEAHIAVMQHIRPGMKEFQLESLFRHWCYYHGGARHMSYTCICATGDNASVLHYGHAGEPNGKTVKAGDLCLFDMGSEFHGYGSDITCAFPASGVFTADQRLVYESVLAAVHAVEDALKPGVSWIDMHGLAYRVLLTGLRDGGLLAGDIDAMMAANLGATFMPHGLGHFLGIDTHDVGGYNGGVARDARAGYRSLRTARTMQAGMFITVEPGCYFIDYLLDEALADPVRAAFINKDVLARFRGSGGVRIEDDVLVTASGCENFSHVPRTVADIEAVMAGRITQRSELAKHH